MSVLLEASEVSKRYHGKAVVERVSLRVRKGEIVTVIGPNGCGKTTLLKLLLGLEKPDSGRVSQAPGLRIGYMPQRLSLDASLPVTVEWMLKLFARGRPLEKAVAQTGIEALLGARLQTLSGGETQRVMLARALLSHPNLLVLDEPVQGVDVSGQAEMYALIARIRREEGVGILMVSHDLHFVMSATDEVICLNRHVCCAGHPQTVQGDPAFAALFGKPVADSLAVYHHHHDHVHS